MAVLSKLVGILMATAILSLAALPAQAQAPAFPKKQVTFYVPYAPGGAVDVVARTIGQALSKSWGQAPIVENRAGAGGTIASKALTQAAPDGHTLILVASGHPLNQFFYPSLPYDTFKDFTAITEVAYSPLAIVVAKDNPAKNLQELLALAKAQPGKLNYGSTSLGGSPHMSAELLKMMAGVDMVHVPYKGAAPMLTDLMGGQVQIGFDNLPSTINFVRSGKVRAIAVTTPQRWPGAPDIPTVAESGLPGYEVSGWFGLLAPAGTPPAVLATIQQALAEAVKQPDINKQMLELGAQPVANTPDAFAKLVQADVAKWRDVVKTTGVKLD